MYERILGATDGSALSAKATRGAIDLASKVGAEIVAVHVVPRYSLDSLSPTSCSAARHSKPEATACRSMKGSRMNRALAVLATIAVLSSAACSQPSASPPSQQGGSGYGGGMGPGMMGQGYGWGMGPGMMGGGYGGMGPGMMGHGWGMAGPATSWRYPADLTQDQREKITQIQTEFWKQQYSLMQQMHSLMWSSSAASDDQTARKNYETRAGLQKQMIDNATEMQKRIEAVLTPKQREELRRNVPY